MIRLAINGVEGPDFQALAARLRGASVISAGEWDAVAMFDCGPETIATAELYLRSNRSVLLSAEACGSLELLDRLVAASGSGATLAVLNGDRYLSSRRVVKEQLDAGKLGAVGLVRIHRWLASETGDSRGTSQPWMLDLDLAAWFVGAMPEKVYAASSENMSCIQMHLGLPGGAMALIDYASGLITGHGYQSMAVIGSSGAAYADDHHNLQLHFPGYSPRAVRMAEGLQRNAAMLQEFVDGLESGRDFSPSVASWRKTLVVAQAVQRSLELRQAVVLEGV